MIERGGVSIEVMKVRFGSKADFQDIWAHCTPISSAARPPLIMRFSLRRLLPGIALRSLQDLLPLFRARAPLPQDDDPARTCDRCSLAGRAYALSGAT